MKATLDVEGNQCGSLKEVTIPEAAFDGLGRRVLKTVSNSGDLDGVTEYYHNGTQIIETRDGSGNLETQVYHGTQYIDEVVGQRIADMGRVYVHQDANYNVTGTTDLTARQIERNHYSPYGQLEVAVDSHPFDYDDDGDIDQDDYAVTTNGTCTGTATADCRRMDADADGDVDSTDQTTISNYIASLTTDTELARIPAATNSQRGNSLGHQGLVFDAELASYQNRARHYTPAFKKFVQPDPLRGSASAIIGYPDGMNAFEYLKSSPSTHRDSSGLQVVCPQRTCHCSDLGGGQQDIIIDVAPQDGLAQLLDALFYGGRGVAVALPGSVVRCSGGCGDCDGQMGHECCHICAAQRGFFAWLFTWIPGDLNGYCTRNAVRVTFH